MCFIRTLLFFDDIEILVTLPHGEGRGPGEQLVAEDLGQEDVVGHILGFKEVAADGAVGAAQVAGLPAKVALAES